MNILEINKPKLKDIEKINLVNKIDKLEEELEDNNKKN
jgi:hypothetical protein